MRRKREEEYTRQSEMIQQYMHEVTHEHGVVSGFVKRQSKMTAEVFAQTMIVGLLDNPEASLNDLVQISAKLGVVISEPGLHGRINREGTALLKGLLDSSLKHFAAQGTVPAEVMQHFTGVDILDSTQITLPKALATCFAGYNSPGTEAALKIQLSIDYLRGRLNALHIGAGRVPDQTCELAVQLATPGSLQLFDMGYAVIDYLRRIGEQDAYFLTPLKTRTNVYAHPDDPLPLDLAVWLEAQASHGTVVDRTVYVGTDERLPVRLVAYRLPQATVDKRRRQARRNARKKGRQVTKRHVQLLAWGLMLTNIPAALLSGETLLTLYRVRWQIELFFKLCKSQFRLAVVGPWRLERLLCQLYARLIGVVLFHWFIAPWRFLAERELSPPKAFRIVRRQALSILCALRTPGDALATILAQITDDFSRYALKSSRQTSPSTLSLLAQLRV